MWARCCRGSADPRYLSALIYLSDQSRRAATLSRERSFLRNQHSFVIYQTAYTLLIMLSVECKGTPYEVRYVIPFHRATTTGTTTPPKLTLEAHPNTQLTNIVLVDRSPTWHRSKI